MYSQEFAAISGQGAWLRKPIWDPPRRMGPDRGAETTLRARRRFRCCLGREVIGNASRRNLQVRWKSIIFSQVEAGSAVAAPPPPPWEPSVWILAL